MTRHQAIIERALAEGYLVDLEKGLVIGIKGKPLKPIPNSQGYAQVSICFSGLPKSGYPVHVHKMIALVKFGTKAFEKGIDVRHLNNNRMDARGSNLALGTRAENNADKTQEALKAPGIKLAQYNRIHPPNQFCSRRRPSQRHPRTFKLSWFNTSPSR